MNWVSFAVGLIILNCLLSADSWSASKKSKPQEVIDGKKGIELAPIPQIQIEMPDRTMHSFGEDFESKLSAHLIQSGKYLLATRVKPTLKSALNQLDYHWNGGIVPAAKISFEVEALSFQTGDRGDRMFYGFDERFRTPFNDGSGKLRNEFPLRIISPQFNWFGHSFDAKGAYPLDSRAGLDLGDGFNIDFLFAWLSVKYAKYHSELHLKINIEALGEDSRFRKVEVKGDGFFFDVAGAYQQYSAGITVARSDAMLQAFHQAIESSFSAIDRALMDLPMVAQVDGVMPDGVVLLGTGPLSDVRPGVLFAAVENPLLVFQVIESNRSGSMSKLIRGDLTLARPGMVLKQVHELPSIEAKTMTKRVLASVPEAYETIQIPSSNFSKANLSGLVPALSRAEAFGRSILEFIFLPYRIARYFLYDQKYHSRSDVSGFQSNEIQSESWAHQIGLVGAPPMEKLSPVVAIIDSGVDYNHPAIHGHIWINPISRYNVESAPDRYGWDFISQDSRPYDDGYHGTQLASLVTAVAPHARILPIKIFNPWGITSSAAINAAFVYAVDHGAQIILCGWATDRKSKAIEMGVAYARDHNVAVVAAAGDFGMDLGRMAFFPAALSQDYSNVLAVSAVDSKDQLVTRGQFPTNFHSSWVQIAAPGESIRVAEPRASYGRLTSSGAAAALTAGVMARYSAASQLTRVGRNLIESVLEDADVISGLASGVRQGLRLRVRK